MIPESIALSVVFGFFLTELTGFLPGGLVVPGYLALFLDHPSRIAATLLAAGLTLACVRLLSRYLVLFGRRRFMAYVLTGMSLLWLFDLLAAYVLPSIALPQGLDVRAIGLIVPGLIANDAARQGLTRTLIGLAIVTLAVRLALFLLQ